MVLSEFIRIHLRRKIDSVGRSLGNAGITPDALTALGFALALLAGFLFASRSSQPYLGGMAVFVSAIMDLLNGAVARAAPKSYTLLDDSIFDRLSDNGIFAGIILGGYAISPTIVVLTLGISLLPSYMSAKAESIGISVASFGVGERADRIAVLIALAIAGYLSIAIYVILILASIDSIQRYAHICHAISKKEKVRL